MLMATLLSITLCQTPANESFPGRAMIDNYFRLQVKQISDTCLNDLTTKEKWEEQKSEKRKQFLEMMGLWPLPEKTDLKATVTGTAEGEGFTVENLHFQSMPGLYVTANVYSPKPARPGRLPAILYVCGHGNTVENGISYGSKVTYQYHPAWFAKHGYVCIILDTLQLGEIKGEHHGTYRLNQWWWQSRGYSPGGVELWNAIRALDYLETRSDVDPKKIGVTGRSGGGATSWWIAAADDRPAAIAPIAGIADLESHVCKGFTERLKSGVIAGHCDCMYMVNQFRWDFAQVAALAAPRPLLLGNSDEDEIFPVPGYRSIAAKVRKVYRLYGLEDRFELLETKGPHKDTPELRNGINRFMNRWLKGDSTTKVEDDLPAKLPAAALKVLKETPKDAINEKIAETFTKKAVDWKINEADRTLPEWWEQFSKVTRGQLLQNCFAGWPTAKPEPTSKLIDETAIDGVPIRSYDIETEPGIAVRFIMANPHSAASLELAVLDELAWNDLCQTFGSDWAKKQAPKNDIKSDSKKWDILQSKMKNQKTALAWIAPRGVGPTRWATASTPDETHIRRRFALIGQTLDGQRIWDVRQTIKAVSRWDKFKKSEITLSGSGVAGHLAAFAAVDNPRVQKLILNDFPRQASTGAIVLRSDTVFINHQLITLLAEKPVTIITRSQAEHDEWGEMVNLARRIKVTPPEIKLNQ